MRGHLGTELENKCDFALEVNRDEETGIYTVGSRLSRFLSFPAFDFERDEEGLPLTDRKPDSVYAPEPVEVYNTKITPSNNKSEITF